MIKTKEVCAKSWKEQKRLDDTVLKTANISGNECRKLVTYDHDCTHRVGLYSASPAHQVLAAVLSKRPQHTIVMNHLYLLCRVELLELA